MQLLASLLVVLILMPILAERLSHRLPKWDLTNFLLMAPVSFITLSGLSHFYQQPLQLNFLETSYFSLGLKMDVLSGVIAASVSTIGAIVFRFSKRYLEDDPDKQRFSKNMSYTVSFVLLMLMAPNLILLFLSWVGASYFLHELLTHFNHRPEAMRAAQQKFWVSRLGDVFIISAGVLLFIIFETLEFQAMFEMINDSSFLEQNYLILNAASILIVFGAMTKSAQFPFHFWLPNTMETPTPVSAIMHAGIINAGGYLVIRTSPILSQAPLALSILAVVGGFTAFWGTIAMFTQTNVKKNLAYSTISQMGFMMLQCGLGVFSIAVVHIIGHAFYKAYAFLSAGTATDYGRLNRYFPKVKVNQSLWSPFLMALLSLSVVIGGFLFSGNSVIEKPGVTVLLIVLSLAVSQIILNSQYKTQAFTKAGTIVLLYIGLSYVMNYLLQDIVPAAVSIEGALGGVTFIVCTSFFVALYFIQNSLDKISETEFGKRVYVKALRGSFS